MAVPFLVVSTTYVPVPVIAPTINGVPANPTGFSVYMALISTEDDPGSGDWMPAIWQSIGPYPYVACCLVGPDDGNMVLEPGQAYWPFVKITASPQTIVLQSLVQIIGA